VSRQLINSVEFIGWARSQGFDEMLDESEFHVTIAFSREKVDWDEIELKTDTMTISGGKRLVEPLGDDGAVVLKFNSDFLPKRWQEIRDVGASWDFEGYTPHVTIKYNDIDIDLSQVEPFTGKLIFGPETMTELNLNWSKDKK
jgi:hypothetical protein